MDMILAKGHTEDHEHKMTYEVEVNIPGHEDRVTTSLFTRTRKVLLESKGARCFICNRTAEEAGHPLEAHHHPIERSLANMVDWDLVKLDFPHFDWSKFDPANPYTFVDDMTVNGLILCKDHHIGKNEGIHMMPYPLWIIQRYGKEGYQYTEEYQIHHADYTKIHSTE